MGNKHGIGPGQIIVSDVDDRAVRDYRIKRVKVEYWGGWGGLSEDRRVSLPPHNTIFQVVQHVEETGGHLAVHDHIGRSDFTFHIGGVVAQYGRVILEIAYRGPAPPPPPPPPAPLRRGPAPFPCPNCGRVMGQCAGDVPAGTRCLYLNRTDPMGNIPCPHGCGHRMYEATHTHF